MKHLKPFLSVLLVCACMFCFATGCGDSEFKEAAKQPATVKYIAVDEDLHLISNYIDERDLKSDGLNENAYFLYGTADKIFFAVTSSDTTKSSTVYSYDIEKREVSTVFSKSGRGGQPSEREYLFYLAMAKENTVSCFYSRVAHKMFADDEYFIRVDDCDLKGNVISSKEYSAQTLYGQFSNNKTVRDMVQIDYLAGKAERYWERRSVSVSGLASQWKYSFHGVNGSYPLESMTSSDAMWNFIHSEREYAQIMIWSDICYQPYGTYGTFGLRYTDNSQDAHYVYFAYEEGGEPQYLFSGGETPLLGLYVVV